MLSGIKIQLMAEQVIALSLNPNHRLLPTKSQVSPSANLGPSDPIPTMSISRRKSTFTKALVISDLILRDRPLRVPVTVTGIRRFTAENGHWNPPVGSTGEGEGEDGEEEGQGIRMPEAPEKPVPGDCCGSGCVRCVWDVYYEELKAYEDLCQRASNPTTPDPS